jgi:hypothetical protein
MHVESAIVISGILGQPAGIDISIILEEINLFLNIAIVLFLDLIVVMFMILSIYTLDKLAKNLGISKKNPVRLIMQISFGYSIIIYILISLVSIYHIYLKLYS